VGVVSRWGLVLDVLRPDQFRRARLGLKTSTYRRADRDTSSLLLGRLVDLTVVHELATALLGKVLGDRSGEGGLAVVDVLVDERESATYTSSLHQWYRCCTQSVTTSSDDPRRDTYLK
jgi:hypothetical protein